MLRTIYIFIFLVSISNSSHSVQAVINDKERCKSSSELYQLILSQKSRTQQYRKALNDHPIYFNLINNWNDYLAAEDVQNSTEMTELSYFTVFTPIKWNDGAQLQLVKNPLKETFDAVKRTALDCRGNTIPASLQDLPDTYVFGAEKEWQAFRNYILLSAWGNEVDFPTVDLHSHHGNIETNCRKTPQKTYKCITNIN